MKLRLFLKAAWISVPRVKPADCASQIRHGRGLLVDVREPKEWPSGVAESAHLLSLTDLCGSGRTWKYFLENVGDRELVLYCGAGIRSNLAARLLRAGGFRAVNGGGLSDWSAAGWPIVAPAGPKA